MSDNTRRKGVQLKHLGELYDQLQSAVYAARMAEDSIRARKAELLERVREYERHGLDAADAAYWRGLVEK